MNETFVAVPGPAIGLIHSGLVGLIDDSGTHTADQLWAAATEGDGLDTILDLLSASGMRDMPSFALVGCEDEGLRVIVRGAAVVDIDDDGNPTIIDGAGVRTWHEIVIEKWTTFSLRLTACAASEGLPHGLVRSGVLAACQVRTQKHAYSVDQPGTDAATDQSNTPLECDDQTEDETDRVDEHVANGGADADADAYADMFGRTTHRSVLDAAVADPEQIVPVEPTAASDASTGESAEDANRTWARDLTSSETSDDSAFSATELDEAGDHDGHTMSLAELKRLRDSENVAGATISNPASEAANNGAPTVTAVLCPGGHPNPPYDSVCRACGSTLQAQPIMVQRPPLGEILFSTGERVVLDRSLLVGRKPSLNGRRLSEIPRQLSIDVGDGLSRSHALFHIEGWQVRVEDLGSTNHTVVTLPGREPQRLREGEPVLIVDGTEVDLGGEVSATYVFAH